MFTSTKMYFVTGNIFFIFTTKKTFWQNEKINQNLERIIVLFQGKKSQTLLSQT